jgi:small subunit ribosomal protein S6
MGKAYELSLLVNSQLPDDGGDEAVKRFEEWLSQNGATDITVDRWGVRKLAYEIKKQQQADFTFMQFEAEPASLSELDRACRLDESVIRHMIVTIESLPQPEAPEPETTEDDGTEEAAEEEEETDEDEGEGSEEGSEEDEA